MTVVLEGALDSTIKVDKQIQFSVDKKVTELIYRLALPANFSNRAVRQQADEVTLQCEPTPERIKEITDSFGNRYKEIRWRNLSADARVSLNFQAHLRAELPAMDSKAAFPLTGLDDEEKVYLRSTGFVQSDAREIASLSRSLTEGAGTEYDAVSAIMYYVADNIKYFHNPSQYDALYTLNAGQGNCTNIAHLSLALLRAAGLPARFIAGTSLNKQMKIPLDNQQSLLETMGQGGHAWIEIYFPDLGWLSYDPKQSKQFTSTRHIKETQGLDYFDIVDTWTGLPYAPRYSVSIDARFLEDMVDLTLKQSEAKPEAYLFSNRVVAKLEDKEAHSEKPKEEEPAPMAEKPKEEQPSPAAKPEEEKPVVASKEPAPPSPEPLASAEAMKPKEEEPAPQPNETGTKEEQPSPAAKPEEEKPVVASKENPPEPAPSPAVAQEPPQPEPGKQVPVTIGNTDFPTLVETYRISGNKGMSLLEAETAEYVTSDHVYAQAFTIDEPMSVRSVSLAMHKFGGEGTLYVDVVSDAGGKPGVEGIRSLPIFLENLERRPGYYWVDFNLGGNDRILEKGKYWIVLRHSGDAVLTWFFIPGKPYGGPNDTRSTLKGHTWEDILNCDFVFKVEGERA